MFYWLSQTCWRISPYSLWTHFYSYDFFFYFGSWPYMLCCSFRLLPPPPPVYFLNAWNLGKHLYHFYLWIWRMLICHRLFITFLLVSLLYICVFIYIEQESKKEKQLTVTKAVSDLLTSSIAAWLPH